MEDLNNSVACYITEITPQTADDVRGSLSYNWTHKDNKWAKMISGKEWSSCPIKLIEGYLSLDDYEKVQKNPRLFRYTNPEREYVSEAKKKEIFEKARLKYIDKINIHN